MISVIIPSFDENQYLLNSIESVLQNNYADCEIIIVESGNIENTIKILKQYDIKIIKSRKGRSYQLNFGAKIAKGNILLFLHADTVLPENSLTEIESVAKNNVGGGFLQKFSGNNFLLKLVSFRSNSRSMINKIFFGDQAVFVRKQIFDKLNGYRDIPIMEDLDFSKRMKKMGKISVIKDEVTVSGRNYLRYGIIKLTLVYFVLMVMYHLRFDFERINKTYNFLKTKLC